MTDDFASGNLLDEMEKTPSISWRDAEVGQKLILRIDELPTKKIHRSKFGDASEKLYWKNKDGSESPKYNTFVKVTVLEGSDVWTLHEKKNKLENPQPVGEVRNWWCNIPSQPIKALSSLNGWMKQEHNRGLQVGDVIQVLLTEKKEIEDKPDYDLQNVFAVTYVRNEAPAAAGIFDE